MKTTVITDEKIGGFRISIEEKDIEGNGWRIWWSSDDKGRYYTYRIKNDKDIEATEYIDTMYNLKGALMVVEDIDKYLTEREVALDNIFGRVRGVEAK